MTLGALISRLLELQTQHRSCMGDLPVRVWPADGGSLGSAAAADVGAVVVIFSESDRRPFVLITEDSETTA